MYFDSTFWTFTALALGVCGIAFWTGEAPERWAAGLLSLSIVPAIISSSFHIPDFPMVELFGDGLTALGLLALTVIYGRLWLGAALLFQAAQFTLHSFYLVTERPNDLIHAVANNVNFLGIMLSLALGTAFAVRRRFVRRRAEAQSS